MWMSSQEKESNGNKKSVCEAPERKKKGKKNKVFWKKEEQMNKPGQVNMFTSQLPNPVVNR